MSDYKIYYKTAIKEVSSGQVFDNKQDAIQYSIELYDMVKLFREHNLNRGVIAVIVKEDDEQIWQNGPI